MLYLLKGCGKRYSDLFRAGDERRCFQCGRVYHPKRSPMDHQMSAEDFNQSEPASEAEPGRKRPKARRSARHLNSVLAATRFNGGNGGPRSKLCTTSPRSSGRAPADPGDPGTPLRPPHH